MSWLISFLGNVLGNCWERLSEVGLKLLMGPLVFFLFGPMFKVADRIARYILDRAIPNMEDIGLTADSLLGWFIVCLRLQDCVTSFITFLVMGFMISILKKVF